MADVKVAYRASSALTVTSLNGLASSSTWTSGWSSGTIDNTTDLDLDKLVSAQFNVESSGVSAGEIRVYVYTMLDDSTWPDLFSSGTEGTQGAVTLHDAYVRDYMLIPLWSSLNDTTASQFYSMPMTSVAELFGHHMPPKCALYVAQSTGTTLETTGNVVNLKGVYRTVV